MLKRLQKGLEELYRIETGLDVLDFIVQENERDATLLDRHSREQLLLQEDAEGMAIGLYFDDVVMAFLQSHAKAPECDAANLGEFLLALEGISHFVYVTRCAQVERQVSALELELQAEVDKYATCLLTSEKPLRRVSPKIRHRLFESFSYCEDLTIVETERYRVANDNAERYALVIGKKIRYSW